MKLRSRKSLPLCILISFVSGLFSAFCHAQDHRREICSEIVEKRMEEIFDKKESALLQDAHKKYEINLRLLKLIMDTAEKNTSLKRAWERYEFSPTDQNLKHFYKAAENVRGDWKFIGQWYGGLSAIVYIHIYNFPDGVPSSRNRDHLLKPLK